MNMVEEFGVMQNYKLRKSKNCLQPEGPQKTDADLGSKKAGYLTPPPCFLGEGSTWQRRSQAAGAGRGGNVTQGGAPLPGASTFPDATMPPCHDPPRAGGGVVTKDPRPQPLVSTSGFQFLLPLPPPPGWTPSCRGHGSASVLVLSHVQPAPPPGGPPWAPFPQKKENSPWLGKN